MKTLNQYIGPFGGMAIQAMGLGFGLLSSILLARLLGAEDFGVYGFAYSIVALVAIPLQSGLAMLLVKEIAAFRSRQDHSRVHGIVRAANRLVIVFSGIAGVAFFGWATIHSGLVDAYTPTLLIAVLLLPPLALGAARGGILRGLDSPIMGQLPDTIIRPGALVLILVSASVLKYDISASLAMGFHVAAAFAGMTFGAIVIRRLMPAEVWITTPIHEWRSWLNGLLPLSAVAGIQALSVSIGTIALAAHWSSAEIAYFRVAELGASVVAMPLGATAVYASARIAKLLTNGDRIALQAQLRHFARLAFFSACALSLPIFFFGEKLLGVMFGHAYEVAWMPLVILCGAQIASAAVGVVGITMTMAGRYTEIVTALTAALAVQLTLTLTLVPRMGSLGAAIASAAGVVAWSQILFWRGKHLLSVSTSII